MCYFKCTTINKKQKSRDRQQQSENKDRLRDSLEETRNYYGRLLDRSKCLDSAAIAFEQTHVHLQYGQYETARRSAIVGCSSLLKTLNPARRTYSDIISRNFGIHTYRVSILDDFFRQLILSARSDPGGVLMIAEATDPQLRQVSQKLDDRFILDEEVNVREHRSRRTVQTTPLGRDMDHSAICVAYKKRLSQTFTNMAAVWETLDSRLTLNRTQLYMARYWLSKSESHKTSLELLMDKIEGVR